MSENQLPSHASVVVIGGGVMGCSTLYHLAKEGVADAILLERNQLTSGTTWHSAAQVRALRSTRNLTDLIRYSISLYSTLEAETGQAVGWINKGSLSIATQPDRLIHIKRQEALAKMFAIRAQSISAGEAKERWPLMNAEDVLGAVWSPDDGRVSPSDLCAALVKGARAKGVKIFEDTGVTGILTQGGRVVGVETDKGEVRCEAIALCTGLWSRKAGAMAGVDVPVWPCEHFYLLTKPIEGISGNIPSLSDHDASLYIRDDSGGLLVGCFEPQGKPIDPQTVGEHTPFQLLNEDWDHFEPMMVRALHRLPPLETAEVKTLLNGPESFTPDGSFLLGETAETQGLYLGCGMNSVGVASGGGAGMALAHCIVHGRTPVDLHEADPTRFAPCFNSVAALSERAPEILGKHYEITYPGRQFSSARNLKTTPLHAQWLAAKAYFGQVYGYERPLYFGCDKPPVLTFARPPWFEQVAAEVQQAHTDAAIFDQSTFGKLEVTGPDACAFLNRVCANQMDRAVDSAIYTAILNKHAGMESDLTAVRLGETHYRLFVGTASVKRDLAWLRRSLTGEENVEITQRTEDFAILGLVGPRARQIAATLGVDELNSLRYFRGCATQIAGVEVYAVRMSYVGEAGWEITCPSAQAGAVYDALYAQGARPAGVFAQTSMRIEKGFRSYGHDLDTDNSPLEPGLGFAVDLNKPFIGRDAYLARAKSQSAASMVSLLLDDEQAVALGNEPVCLDGVIVGKTTSAAFGYRVGKPVALAYVNRNDYPIDDGTRVTVDIAGEHFCAGVRLSGVFDPSGERMRG